MSGYETTEVVAQSAIILGCGWALNTLLCNPMQELEWALIYVVDA